MDVLDQAHAPGCPAIGPGGLYTEELLQAVRFLAQEADTSGIEIVEVSVYRPPGPIAGQPGA